MVDSKKTEGKNRNFEEEILNFLRQMAAGQTITDIANAINSTRITVSKYINGLEKEEKVFSKKIGAYNLYFSSERNYVPRDLAIGFYEGILSWMKHQFEEPESYKELGHTISKFLPMPKGTYENVLPSIVGTSSKFLKYFGKVFTYYDFVFEEKLNVDVLVDKNGNSAIYKLNDIQLLGDNTNFDHHFQIMAGVMESLISRLLEKETTCNLDFIDVEKKIIQFSIKIQQNKE